MQTFLPLPDFAESARCLDRLRLGKQRVECLQLLRALLVPGSGWTNHPAARMWRGHELSLVCYGWAVCAEWVRRGYRDTCSAKITALGQERCPMVRHPRDGPLPSWLGGPIHASHRSNLLRKDPVWYGRFGWVEPADLPYVWPESNHAHT